MFNYFTKLEAKVLLGVSFERLEELLLSEELEHFMMHGRVRISEGHINEFKKGGNQNGKAA